MKKYLLSLLAFLSIYSTSLCQNDFPYTIEVFTEEYNHLENYFPLNIDPMWDVPITQLNMQFEFPCFGDTADLVRLSDLGGSIEIFMENGDFHLISGTNADLNDVLNVIPDSLTDGSFHRSIVEGVSPNRVFKLEYFNVGFDWEMMTTGGASSVANFQIWLFENGDIEIHYGPHTIQNLSDICFWSAATAGLSAYWNFEEFTADFLWANGPADTPNFMEYYGVEYDSLQISPIFTGLDTWPNDGQVYRFSYDLAPIINIDETVKPDLSIYPNPSSEFIIAQFPDNRLRQVSIYNANGAEVNSFQTNDRLTINVCDLSPGSYFLRSDLGEEAKLVIK